MVVSIGGVFRGIAPDTVRHVLDATSCGHTSLLLDDSGDISWALQSTNIGSLEIRDIEGLARAAMQTLDRICSHLPHLATKPSLLATISLVHEDGLVCPIDLSTELLRLFCTLHIAQLAIVELLDDHGPHVAISPFSFMAQFFPTLVDFRVTVTSLDHDLETIQQAIGLPDWPIFRRKRQLDANGRAIRPSRWRLRPVFSFEQRPESSSWSNASVAAVLDIWTRLRDAQLTTANINVDVWPETRFNQSRCVLLIPQMLLEMSSRIPLEIQIRFTGLQFGIDLPRL